MEREITTGRAYEGEVRDDRHHLIAGVRVMIQPDGKSGAFEADGKADTRQIEEGRFISSRTEPMVRSENVRRCEIDGPRRFHFSVRAAPEKARYDTSIPVGTKILSWLSLGVCSGKPLRSQEL